MTHDGVRTKQKSRLHMSHAQNDARYVERGKMIHLTLPDNMGEELKRMNAGKNGHPFVYSECLVMAIIGIRLQLGIALRCAEGMTIEFMINRLEKNFRKNIGITYGEVKAQHG